MSKEIIQTDLNDRERSRFAESCRTLSKAAGELADALEAKNEDQMLIKFVMVTLMLTSLNEPQQVIEAAIKKRNANPADFLTPEESASRL